ncbi:hypothetical protein DPMN_121568 [Dreissena polymorpha]|uniref:Uncharacterized protein n=1 Tax=Dreissena polymorpha TaxID=45954 RepID=A0A9D4GQY7_DREPO|nr:hypothetical protein DPMN_121568 [Dreissena polymorpha]
MFKNWVRPLDPHAAFPIKDFYLNMQCHVQELGATSRSASGLSYQKCLCLELNVHVRVIGGLVKHWNLVFHVLPPLSVSSRPRQQLSTVILQECASISANGACRPTSFSKAGISRNASERWPGRIRQERMRQGQEVVAVFYWPCFLLKTSTMKGNAKLLC